MRTSNSIPKGHCSGQPAHGMRSANVRELSGLHTNAPSNLRKSRDESLLVERARWRVPPVPSRSGSVKLETWRAATTVSPKKNAVGRFAGDEPLRKKAKGDTHNLTIRVQTWPKTARCQKRILCRAPEALGRGLRLLGKPGIAAPVPILVRWRTSSFPLCNPRRRHRRILGHGRRAGTVGIADGRRAVLVGAVALRTGVHPLPGGSHHFPHGRRCRIRLGPVVR